ncbi:MAG: hypothetical protein KDC44_00980 [Phaeodactylibacter sp.]|nr:hypothetical protein [Phaeodactylibacter sp.]
MNRKTSVLLCLCCLCCIHETAAQLYAESKTQHRFAQTYIGLNTQLMPASGQLVWQDEQQPFPTQIVPRLTIGGLHFWGKLDFNMNFPLTLLGDRSLTAGGEVRYNPGADLSARYYPWRMLFGKVRPYFGVSLNQSTLILGSEARGRRADIFINTSLLGGLSFAAKGWQLNAEVMYMPRSQRDFYSTLQHRHTFQLPQVYPALGLIRFFDVTLKEEAPKLAGKTQVLEKQLLAEGKLNSFSIGFAPSSAYFIQAPPPLADYPSLPRHKGNVNLEFGLGYLFHQANLHLGLTYRSYTSNTDSYTLEHLIKRQALSLEVYKFLWDYNGFVPFAGLSLSGERWATGLFAGDVQQGETQRSQLLSPGLIFGWDILASPLETWILRTNLRYYPFQNIKEVDGSKVRVDQFEFNFIQLVIYPNRMKHIGRAKQNFY